MEIWQICTDIGLLCLILEMLVPSMFFLNFAFAAFIVAVYSTYNPDIPTLSIVFVAVSLLLLLFLRPLLVKKSKQMQETGVSGKYIGQVAKVVKPINATSGVISLYDERWEARSSQEIPIGKEVIIERNESLIMYVKERV